MDYDYYGNYYDDDGVEIPRWKIERENLFRNAGHIPNKNEARKLRQLMAETGLKEEELRRHKKYRKILSDSQKPEIKKEKTDKLLKYITKKLALAKEHPTVTFVYKSITSKSTTTYRYLGKTVEEFLMGEEFKKHKIKFRIKQILKKI